MLYRVYALNNSPYKDDRFLGEVNADHELHACMMVETLSGKLPEGERMKATVVHSLNYDLAYKLGWHRVTRIHTDTESMKGYEAGEAARDEWDNTH